MATVRVPRERSPLYGRKDFPPGPPFQAVADPGGPAYPTHRDLIARVELAAKRRAFFVQELLREAFRSATVRRELEVIALRELDEGALADILHQHPGVLKPLLLVANVASRALDRDLGIRNLDTYEPRISRDQAARIAAYIHPFLPESMPLSALVEMDRVAFIDKEIRRGKGGWEVLVRERLEQVAGVPFRKAKFVVGGEAFEIDAAHPALGPIKFAVDIKRIEARRDIHKRCDEIINKAARFKEISPSGRFAAILFYPFVAEHVRIQSRLQSPPSTS